jgi:hypothetical protein
MVHPPSCVITAISIASALPATTLSPVSFGVKIVSIATKQR